MSGDESEESTNQVAVVAKTEASGTSSSSTSSAEHVGVEATKPDPEKEHSDDNVSNSDSESNNEDGNDSDILIDEAKDKDEEEDEEITTEPTKPDSDKEDDNVSNSDNESKDGDTDDSDGDDAENKEEEDEAKDQDEVKASAEPTDEFGRPLSAYEIMRLERIKRNQAYLAKLGLEADSNSGKKGFLLAPNEKKAAKKKKKEVVVQRRTSVGRRTKAKKVDYTEKKIKQKIDLLSKQEKTSEKKEKTEKQKTKDNSVPLFIYREFRNMEVSRRQNMRTAEKLVRSAELQMRMANREVESLQRKDRRLRDRETRDVLIPIVQEIEKRRIDIIKALRRIDGPEKQQISKEELRNQAAERLSEAEKRFPEAAQEAELSLARMLIERLPPFQNVENNNMKVKSGKNNKKAKGKNAENSKDPSPDQKAKVVTVPVLPANLDLEGLRKIEEGLKVRVQKSRNVGGPVTAKFAGAVQRKWLDGDGPTAASFNEYVPQVGDTVL